MFKFGKKKNSLQLPELTAFASSSSSGYALVSPRPHHSISFNPTRTKQDHDAQLRFTQKVLPSNFAENLLNLEIELDLNENVQIETIQELIQLYMTGVEYYESLKDRKHIYFQRKLNSIMTRPSFFQATNQKNDESLMKKQKFEDQQKKLTLDLMYGDKEKKEFQVKEIVDQSTDSLQKMEKIILQDIEKQDDNIKKRLQQRKNSRMQKSNSLPKLVIENESPTKEEPNNINIQSEQLQVVNLKGIINEVEEENITRKDSYKNERKWELIRKSVKKLQKSSSLIEPRDHKRHSVFVGLDAVNQLLKKNKKERAKSNRDTVKLNEDKKEFTKKQKQDIREELEDDAEALNSIYSKQTQNIQIFEFSGY